MFVYFFVKMDELIFFKVDLRGKKFNLVFREVK